MSLLGGRGISALINSLPLSTTGLDLLRQQLIAQGAQVVQQLENQRQQTLQRKEQKKQEKEAKRKRNTALGIGIGASAVLGGLAALNAPAAAGTAAAEAEAGTGLAEAEASTAAAEAEAGTAAAEGGGAGFGPTKAGIGDAELALGPAEAGTGAAQAGTEAAGFFSTPTGRFLGGAIQGGLLGALAAVPGGQFAAQTFARANPIFNPALGFQQQRLGLAQERNRLLGESIKQRRGSTRFQQFMKAGKAAGISPEKVAKQFLGTPGSQGFKSALTPDLAGLKFGDVNPEADPSLAGMTLGEIERLTKGNIIPKPGTQNPANALRALTFEAGMHEDILGQLPEDVKERLQSSLRNLFPDLFRKGATSPAAQLGSTTQPTTSTERLLELFEKEKRNLGAQRATTQPTSLPGSQLGAGVDIVGARERNPLIPAGDPLMQEFSQQEVQLLRRISQLESTGDPEDAKVAKILRKKLKELSR